MEGALLGLAALACPVGMGLMMLLMAKGMRKGGDRGPGPQEMSLEQLREESRRLDGELARLSAAHGADGRPAQ